MSGVIRIALLVTCWLALSGCTSIAYYAQSVIGHSKLMLARQPIEAARADAQAAGDQGLASALNNAIRLRQFAVHELSLPDNKSYTSYVPLERDSPVYTVVAAEEFSVQAKQWCYLIVGCASYRGYFSRSSAEQYAASLQRKGLETSVGGAVAYSTLGWFSDPLLPSMLRHGEANSAQVLFHELAHQQLYIKGDSAFNEAFASLVGELGAQRWLSKNSPHLLIDFHKREAAYRQFSDLLERSKEELAVVYASSQSAVQKRAQKAKIFTRLKRDYASLKQHRWQGLGWFDGWFVLPLNNARLAAYSTYHAKLDPLRALLQECSNDLPRFYTRLANLSAIDGQVPIPRDCML